MLLVFELKVGRSQVNTFKYGAVKEAMLTISSHYNTEIIPARRETGLGKSWDLRDQGRHRQHPATLPH